MNVKAIRKTSLRLPRYIAAGGMVYLNHCGETRFNERPDNMNSGHNSNRRSDDNANPPRRRPSGEGQTQHCDQDRDCDAENIAHNRARGMADWIMSSNRINKASTYALLTSPEN